MTPAPLRRRLRLVAWLSSLGGGLTAVAIIAGVANSSATAAVTSSDPTSTSPANSSSANSTTDAGGTVDEPAEHQAPVGGSHGS